MLLFLQLAQVIEEIMQNEVKRVPNGQLEVMRSVVLELEWAKCWHKTQSTLLKSSTLLKLYHCTCTH